MKFFLLFLIFSFVALEVDSYCATCGAYPYTNPSVDCSCPGSSIRYLRKYPCGPACDAIGHCCECPGEAALACRPDQYFDKKTCSCKCREPCKECSKYQTWNEKTCRCECPFMASCIPTHFWNDWTCRCECKQKPRPCCPGENKKWDKTKCDCVCDVIYHCHPGQVWNKWTCQCEWIYAIAGIDIDRIEQADPCFGNPPPICNSEQRFNEKTCKCEWLKGWGTENVAVAEAANDKISV